jgi:DNA repair photolyase
MMPEILRAAIASPPRVFVIQTRGPLILRDVDLLRAMGNRVRVSFSVTTDRDDVRRIFEPHCASVEERWRAVAALRDAGISVSVAMAPILPCDPEALVEKAALASNGPLIADPFHVRAVKRSGATTREAAARICERRGWSAWLDPEFQRDVLARMDRRARALGREFGYGPAGFGMLAQ